MRLLATVFVLVATQASAAEDGARKVTAAAPDFFSGTYLLQVFGSLVVVIGLMFGVLWALRKFNGVGTGVGGQLKVVASVGLGQREKAVLVNAGNTQLLIGVAPGSVRTLHVFDEPIDSLQAASATDATPQVTFGDVWKQAMGKNNGDAS